MILGVIDTVDSVNGLKVIIDGESSPSTKKYSYIASYVPVANDRVIIEEINGSYVIIGKIVSEIAESGIVRQADNATNATHASTADSATTATSATTAASCTGNAATATTAAACTGNAATATVSATTKGFDYSVSSESGMLVTNVQSQYSSQLGMYIVTAVNTGISHNYTYK